MSLSIIKNTKVDDDLNVQFRAEFFNALNHPNFDLPDNFLGSPDFRKDLVGRKPAPHPVRFEMDLVAKAIGVRSGKFTFS